MGKFQKIRLLTRSHPADLRNIMFLAWAASQGGGGENRQDEEGERDPEEGVRDPEEGETPRP